MVFVPTALSFLKLDLNPIVIPNSYFGVVISFFEGSKVVLACALRFSMDLLLKSPEFLLGWESRDISMRLFSWP
jgi:hypothetical protein